jgi:vacuolar protein 8
MVQNISEKGVEGSEDGDMDEDGESGENEVVGLAKRCLELLGVSGTGKSLVEG